MYNKPIRAAIFACIMFLFFPNFVGADEAAIKSGEKKAMVCTACHGIENSNNPEWPNLSQQSKKYLVEQLYAFRDGVRNNALMSSQAMGLTDEDIYDLAKIDETMEKGGEFDDEAFMKWKNEYAHPLVVGHVKRREGTAVKKVYPISRESQIDKIDLFK